MRAVATVVTCVFTVGVGAGSAQAALSPIGASPVGGPGSAEAQFSNPVGVDVNATTGDVYVTDTGNNRVQVFDADGTFVSTFGWGVDDGSAALQTCTSGCEAGIAGGGDGQLSSPAGIAIDPNSGDVYVASADDGRIAQFRADGTFVQTFADTPAIWVGQYDTMAFAPSGVLYVATPGQILGFDATGAPQPDFPGYAGVPVAADFDSAGRMYVVDTNGSQAGIHIFDQFAGEILPQLLPSAPPSALAVDRSTDRLLAGQQVGSGDAPELRLNTLESNGDVVVHDFAAGAVRNATGSAYNPNAALPGTEGGAYYVADADADRLVILSSIPAQPRIQTPAVTDVGAREAALRAAIDPNYRATTYSFEIGETTAYGTVVPATPGNVGADGIEHAVAVNVEGLAPQTTYHYRVIATNALGTAESVDRTFKTDPLGAPLRLPDNRVWEQVSPIDKSDNQPQTPESAGGAPSASFPSIASGGVAYATVGAFPGAEASTRYNIARSVRGTLDWSTTILDPSINPPAFLATGSVLATSADLSRSVVQTTRALTGGAVEGEGNLYLRDNDSGTYSFLGGNPDPSLGEVASTVRVVGGSLSFDHIVLITSLALTPDATNGLSQTYEWTPEDGLQLVPDSSGARYGNDFGDPVAKVGRRFVYFGTDGTLYVRENGVSTQIAPPATMAFWSMNRDGSKIIFSSDARLAPEARSDRLELYRYDVETREYEVVTAGLDIGRAGEAQQVRTVVAVSDDAQTVAFTGIGTDGPGGPATTPPKLYLSRNGTTSFISTTPDDYRRGNVAASPSGRYMLLTLSNELTDQPTGGFPQIFRYDGDTHQIVCISCRPSNVRPTAGASLGGAGQRNVLDDGRSFFETRDSVIGEDTNGRADVYQWSDGQPRLLSDGVSNSGSYFAGVSLDGTDAYFTTRARLVGRDTDDYVDVYDARIGGGLSSQAAPPEVPPCAGESCQGPLPAPPIPPTIGSITFFGPGNEPDAPVVPTKPKVRVSGGKTVRGSSAKIKITVPSAGTITVSGSGVRTRKQTAKKAATYTVVVALTRRARQQLARKHTVRVVARIRFAPKSGSASSATVRITMKEPRRAASKRAAAGSRGKR